MTNLYPHQLKAITFLLEREHERLSGLDNKPPSLWQDRDIDGRKSWFHVVTQREVFEQPIYPKGSILADDVSLSDSPVIFPSVPPLFVCLLPSFKGVLLYHGNS